MTTVLVVEDEPRIASFLHKGLVAAGFEVLLAEDGESAVPLARDEAVDLVLLDVGLPGGKDGFAVLRELRAAGQTLPVLLLTARDAVPDRVTGLDAGADDYVVKPFSFEELLARIRARLRDSSRVLRAGPLSLDLLGRTVEVGGRTVELTAQEFALAEAFFRAPGEVLSREQLLRDVWGISHDPGSNLVDVYVGYLRKKLGRSAVQTVRGAGYRLVG